MLTLDKIAGYSEDNLVEKVAEAMDFLEANDVDPIGGLTALMNVDAEGNPTDEKVANELNKIAGFQLDALAKVAEYLAGENPEDIAKVALDLDKLAKHSEKKHHEDARSRIDRSTVATMLAGNLGSAGVGAYDGYKKNHTAVGLLLGNSGVNGAVAKDSGVSTLGTTVGRSARNVGIIGGTLGGLGGAVAGGLHHGAAGALVGGLGGAAIGGGLGAGAGATGAGIGYGLGHLFGSDQSHLYKKHKKHR